MNRLKMIRTSRGKAIFEIAAEGHVSPSMLSAVERYGYTPTRPVREKIARVLSVAVEQIWPEAD